MFISTLSFEINLRDPSLMIDRTLSSLGSSYEDRLERCVVVAVIEACSSIKDLIAHATCRAGRDEDQEATPR